MSIHRRLAGLLSSTILGGYAPLKALDLTHNWIYGQDSGVLRAINAVEHGILGNIKGHFHYYNEVMHTVVGPHSVLGLVNMAHHYILGFLGLFLQLSTQHVAIVEVERTGYGTHYGGSYGD